MAHRGSVAPVRVAVALLALGVFLCLALPMTSGDMGLSHVVAFVCCFILAVVLGGLVLRRPVDALLLRSVPARPRSLHRRGDAAPRPPDVNALGVLLI